MPKKRKTRHSLEDILASCSDTLYPAEMGAAPVSLNSRDCDGDTPLHVMLWRDDLYAVKLLIEAGADVNAVGDMSETPLHVAFRKQNLNAVKALLAAGAKETYMSEFGQSPWDMAQELSGGFRKAFTNV